MYSGSLGKAQGLHGHLYMIPGFHCQCVLVQYYSSLAKRTKSCW